MFAGVKLWIFDIIFYSEMFFFGKCRRDAVKCNTCYHILCVEEHFSERVRSF